MTDGADTSGAEAGAGPTKIRFYRFSNRLRAKTGVPAGATARISAEALQKAQSVIDEMAQDYPDWAIGQVDQLGDIGGGDDVPAGSISLGRSTNGSSFRRKRGQSITKRFTAWPTT